MTAVLLNCQGTIGVHLPAQDLSMLHTKATCFAALRPLSYIPAKGEKKKSGHIFSVKISLTLILTELKRHDSDGATQSYKIILKLLHA